MRTSVPHNVETPDSLSYFTDSSKSHWKFRNERFERADDFRVRTVGCRNHRGYIQRDVLDMPDVPQSGNRWTLGVTGKVLAGERPLIYGDGRQTRDYVYVGDVVAANLAAAAHPEAHGAYNIGTGTEATVIDVLSALRQAAGLGQDELQPEFAPARALYARYGFVPCGPFGDYAEDPCSTFMTRALAGPHSENAR
jgi:nucleoside-diphosphate-sugar epimerase